MTVKTTDSLGVLLRSFEALYNWRALTVLAASFVLGGLAVSGGAAAALSSGSGAVMALMSLLGVLVIVVGVNASGLMLVDQAYDQPVRGFAAAFLGGVQAALYVIGLLILLGLAFAAILLVAYLLSLPARIPVVGGWFGFLLAGPLAAVVALALAALLLGVPLMTVAVWHGEGFLASLTRAASIVVKRPLVVFMHFLVLALLVFPAIGFVFAVIVAGSTIVGGFFAAGSLGMGGAGAMRDMEAMATGALGGPGLSIGLVWFLAWSVIGLIDVLGAIFIYRAVSEGVGSEASEIVGRKLAQFKRTLDEYKPRAAPAAPSGTVGAAPVPPAASEPASVPHCPACGAAVQLDDAYCGGCGHKLR